MNLPRRIIQTQRDLDTGRVHRESWLAHHPGYDYLFFDDAQCRRFVAEHAADCLDAYDKLPLPAQKSDLFRYVAVHALGGFYSDVDTVCCAPLDSYLDLQGEQLIAGMEMAPAFFAPGIEAYVTRYCLPYQLLQWTFGATPGHPALALLLARIRHAVAQMSVEQLAEWSRRAPRFTLELTGPMLFSQVLAEFLSGTRAGRVTVLPRIVWGAYPAEQARPDLAPQVKVRHLFEGSWRAAPSPAPPVAARYSFRL